MKRNLQARKATIIGSTHQFLGMLLVPVLIPYLLSQGFTDQQIAFYWMIFPLVGIFASIIIGEAVKKVHLSWLIFICLLLNASAIPLYIIAQDWSIIVARILDGLSFTSITLLTLTKLEAHVHAKRGQTTGNFLLIQQCAKYGSPIIGGFLGEIFITLPMIISFIGLLALAFSLKHPYFFRKEKTKVKLRTDLKVFFQNRHMQAVTGVGFFSNMSLVFRDILMPLIIVNEFGLSVKSVGLATTFFGIGGLLQRVWGKIVDRFMCFNVMISGLILLSIGWLGIAFFASNYYIFLGILIFISFAQSLTTVSVISFVGQEPKKEIGTDLGFYATFAKLAVFIGTALIGVLIPFFPYKTLIIILCGGFLAATITLYALYHDKV